jgi:uncharacterized protein GlcG (DUF336 family)
MKRKYSQRLLPTAVLLGLSMAAVGQAPDERPAVPALPAKLALEAVQAALEECAAQGWPHVAATILDSGGEMKAMLAADGTPPGHAVPHSLMKARTAQLFRMASGDVQAKAAHDPNLAARLSAAPDALARPGGEPLVMHGVFVGAIGVSGAPGGDKDNRCALAGVARIG